MIPLFTWPLLPRLLILDAKIILISLQDDYFVILAKTLGGPLSEAFAKDFHQKVQEVFSENLLESKQI